MSFHYPQSFILVTILLLLVYIYKLKKSKWLSINVSHFDLMRNSMKSSFLNKYLLLIIRLTILFLLIIVMAGPYYKNIVLEKEHKWVDIVLALDVSLSMLAEDMDPNRITVAKNTINDFIWKLRKWDRLSLIVFSWRAFTYFPLTWDFSIVKDLISYISINLINQNIIWLNWTWIWNAILSSISKFDNMQRQKVIILMTDWESNRGIDPKSAVKLAYDKKIKIYTVWMWKKEGAVVPFVTQAWERIHIKNPDDSLYLTYLDEWSLKNVAEKTWWKYFLADSKFLLKRVFDEIYDLEKWSILLNEKIDQKESYLTFLQLAFLLLLLEIILSISLFKRKI